MSLSPSEVARIKDQLLITLVRRLLAQKALTMGEISVPATEVDETGGFLLSLSSPDGVNILIHLDKKH